MNAETNQNKEAGSKRIEDTLRDKYASQINAELTFAGAVKKYYDEYSKYWHQKSTINLNLNYLLGHIVPVFSKADHLKPIREYLLEDYDRCTEEIVGSGARRFSESTIKTIRRLIYYVVRSAAAGEHFSNPLWGSVYALPQDENPKYLEKVRLRLQKSLTVAQEATVAQRLLRTPPGSGLDLGLLMMYALGLRNGEACGADFGDLKTMTARETDSGEPHTFDALWIYKSVGSASGALQSSGKTVNADRIVPVPPMVANIIREREAFVQARVPEEDTSSLPIVCSDRSLKTRARTADLTKAGKQLMMDLKADEDLISAIDAELLSGKTLQALRDVRDPTAYLFRRNFVTHLMILGLTESEIQYVIGHDIEDAYERRNDFVTEERIWEIARKLQKRPLLNGSPDEMNKSIHIHSTNDSRHYLKNVNYREVLIDGRKGIHILVEAREPGEELICRVGKSAGPAESERIAQTKPRSSSFYDDRTVNVIEAYHRAYTRVLRKRAARNPYASQPDDGNSEADDMPPEETIPEPESFEAIPKAWRDEDGVEPDE